MQTKHSVMIVLILGLAVACSSQVVKSNQPVVAEIPATSSPQAGNELKDVSGPLEGPERERDLVAAYVAEISRMPVPAEDWNLQDSPQAEPIWLYTNGPWVVNMTTQSQGEGQTVYKVTVDHMSAFIRWEGTIDASGDIVEMSFVHGSLPEAPPSNDEGFWIGVLVSNPPDSQFDDYFQMMDQNGSRSGIEGVDGAIQEKLSVYRDTGVVVQVWGSFLQDVPDAYGTQILVTQVEPYSQ